MKRKAYLTLLIASALLCVATLLFWWQSYNAARYLIGYWSWDEQTRSISIGIEPGQLAIVSGTKVRNQQRGVTFLVRHGQIPDSISWADERDQWEAIGFRYYGVSYSSYIVNPRHETVLDIPAWFIVLLFVCIGAWSLRGMKRTRGIELKSAALIPAPGIPGEG